MEDLLKKYLDQGIQLRKEGKLVGAMEQFQEALKLDGDYFPALNQLAEVYEEKKEWKEAIATYEHLIKLEPAHSLTRGKLARAYMNFGQLDLGIEEYEKAIQLNPESPPWIYNNLGEALEQKGRLEAAVTVYENAIKVGQTSPFTYKKLADTLLLLRRKGEAEIVYYQALDKYFQLLELEPDQPSVLIQLAGVYESLKDFEKAISCHRRVLQIQPDNMIARARLVRAKLGQEDILGAVEEYEEIADNPQLPVWVYNELGDAFWKISELEKACALYRQGIKLYPQNVDLIFRLGKTFSLLEKWDEGIDCYQTATKIAPTHWNAYYYLGDALVQLKRYDEAEIYYQLAEGQFYLTQNFKKSDLPPDFDWQVYLELNLDLKKKGLCKLEAIRHFMLSGIEEERFYSLADFHNPKRRPDIAEKSVRKTITNPVISSGVQRLAVLVHIYYFELWSELFGYIQHIPEEFDLFINVVESIWTPKIHEQLRQDAPNASILITKNRGKDIGGQLALMNQLDFSEYDLFCLLHTKKSPHVSKIMSDLWRKDLLSAILGSEEKVKTNLEIMRENSTIGLLGSRYWRHTELGKNALHYHRLLEEFAIKEDARECEYLSGTMMLVRPGILQPIYEKFKDVELEDGDGGDLAFHMDGQIAHALERIIGNLVRHQGMEFFWQE
ncbi:MAG: tetratricopeptide repeat protein [Gomphosphaeria aponina SAG 52.96 = DSM 107014]|uniref:Tetratricopeptide repeat protein n=1 Tax=Gomphosphaeria aponina SAG 52.96 = DSM 107014 TaxID=1521640 RepID=A0A941GWF7_9CHRO|nr:tetratricopeptide repeat protein [Gomphosphaeria aponina SAG 52.96 = DSM 107014]